MTDHGGLHGRLRRGLLTVDGLGGRRVREVVGMCVRLGPGQPTKVRDFFSGISILSTIKYLVKKALTNYLAVVDETGQEDGSVGRGPRRTSSSLGGRTGRTEEGGWRG